jgi:hypothetical protein
VVEGLVCRYGVGCTRREEPKRKSIAMTLMRDVQGTAAEKLAMFERVRAAGGFANEHPTDLAEAEKMLRRRWRKVAGERGRECACLRLRSS